METTQQVSSSQHHIFENIPLGTVESHWEALFNQYDKNGDGRVPVKHLFKELNENNSGVPDYVIKRILILADRNHDGYITLPEFLELVERKHVRPIFKSSLQRYVQTFVPRPRRKFVEDVDGSYEQEYSCDPPPVTMIIFSIIEILFFLYDRITAPSTLSPNAFFFKLFVYNPHKRYEVWRFFTYMFIHGSEIHLIVNLIVQLLLGIPLEMVHHWWRILVIYVAGVFSGSLLTSIADPNVYLAGASGGCYALLLAHIATIIMNWTEMDHPFLQLSIFLILITFDVSNAIYDRYFVPDNKKIAYAAHFAGAVAGFLVGLYILRNLKVRPWERILWWVSFMTFNVLILVAVLWNIFYPSYFSPMK